MYKKDTSTNKVTSPLAVFYLSFFFFQELTVTGLNDRYISLSCEFLRYFQNNWGVPALFCLIGDN